MKFLGRVAGFAAVAGLSLTGAHLDAQALAALLDPTLYTGLCAEMARDGAKRARKAAAEIGRA